MSPRMGLTLIDTWLVPLQPGENTRPLTQLRARLKAQPVDGPAVQITAKSLAEPLSLLATNLSGEGEMTALLAGLATALRQAASTSGLIRLT